MTGVTSSTIFSNSWQVMFDFLEAQLTDPSSRSAKWIYGGFPDSRIDDKTAYPLIVLNPVVVMPQKLTFSKRKNLVRFSIDIYTTNPNHLDSIADEIIYDVEHNINTFHTNHLWKTNSDPTTSYPSALPRAGFNVKHRAVNFEFMFTCAR